ncbi:hypothetical protein D7V82_19085 [bacterium 1xD8-6]|jgi:Nucleotidyltransferase domain.|nr:hypothetical protein D7V72_16190 [bacterium D16-36]RKI64045.1 hypothetical protein D7V82_19085 [bacterium 1xD8-6]
MECKTWEEQKNVECNFRVLADVPKVKMSRIHPLQQKAVKRIHDAIEWDERVAAIVLFGSSVNLRCTIHSDLDLVVRLRPEFVNNETKNEVSEKIQEACGWNADVLWYDRICNSKNLMNNVLKGVQIL